MIELFVFAFDQYVYKSMNVKSFRADTSFTPSSSRTRSGQRLIPTTMSGWAERVQKRAQNAEEAEEVASILIDLSDSFALRTDRKLRFCEAGTNIVSDAVKLSGDMVAFRRMTSPNTGDLSIVNLMPKPTLAGIHCGDMYCDT